MRRRTLVGIVSFAVLLSLALGSVASAHIFTATTSLS